MEEFRTVLLDVWREACRHIEIGQSTETIAAMLAKHLPIAQVLVRQIDSARGCVETVAMGGALPAGPVCDARRECSPAAMEFALAWCKVGKAVHGRRHQRAELETRRRRPASRKTSWLVRFRFPTAAGPCSC